MDTYPTKRDRHRHHWQRLRGAWLLGLLGLLLPSLAQGDPASAPAPKRQLKALKRDLRSPKARPLHTVHPRYHSAEKESKQCAPKCLKYKGRCTKKVKTCVLFKEGKACRKFKRFCLAWKKKCIERVGGKCTQEKRVCSKPSGPQCVAYKASDCVAFKHVCAASKRVCIKYQNVCCWKRCKKPRARCLVRKKHCRHILPRHCRKWREVCLEKRAACAKMIEGKCVKYKSICTKKARLCAAPKAGHCPSHKPWCRCIQWVKTCQSQTLVCRVPRTVCAG